jgi:RNA polymerase sigma-70 factor, ECF subfamily
MSIDCDIGSASRLTRLMAAIQRRDEAAFAELYHLTKGKIFATILMIIPHRQSAEDVFQEVYTRIWTKAQSYDPTKSSPITWLATIARNLSIDRVRHRDLDREASSGQLENVICPSLDVLSRIVAEQENTAIFKALTCLKARDRRLIEAAYFRGESREQLSLSFGAPVNTIKTWLRRALLDLQARCDDRDTLPRRQLELLASPATGSRDRSRLGRWRSG